MRVHVRRSLAGGIGQPLYPTDLERHGFNVRRMCGTRNLQLQCRPLVVKELVQLAKCLIARCRETGFLLLFLPVHFDMGNHIGYFVACRYCAHS